MSTTRSVRPTDLVALVSLDGRVYPNEARTWDRLGRRPAGPRLLDSALIPWFSFATGRHTWISIQGQAIRGLISARQRGNRTAWEIDCLIAATEDEWIVANLFEQAGSNAGRAGVLKIFLRLEAGSDLLSPARRAGFVPYLEERLLRCEAARPGEQVETGVKAEPCQTSDAFALYRLYNASVPETVRRIEAPTFQQWLAAAEKRTSGRARRNLVVRRDSEVVAQLRASHDSDLAKIDLSVHPAHRDVEPALIHLACSYAGPRRPIVCLVPSYAEGLMDELEEAGFSLDSEYVVLVKRTALPLASVKPLKVRVAPARPLAVV